MNLRPDLTFIRPQKQTDFVAGDARVNEPFIQYCDSNIGLFLLLLVKLSLYTFWYQFFAFFYGSLPKVIALPTIAILFANAFKSVKERNSLKSDNYMGSNTEKKPRTNLQNSYKNWSKEIKSDNFCHCKVGRVIILLLLVEPSSWFDVHKASETNRFCNWWRQGEWTIFLIFR